MGIEKSMIVGIFFSTISYITVFFIRYWSSKREFLDIPNERSLHDRPMPRGGGLIIVIFTLLGTGLLISNHPDYIPKQNMMIYIITSALIALIGLLDDIFHLPSYYRLVFQLIGAFIVINFIGWWSVAKIPFYGEINLGWSGYIITFLWIIGLTNAYNFMDGIDGMAAGQAVVAGIGWFIIGQLISMPHISIVGILIASTSLGFLGHNWSPAKIFLGDVGSAFLGFTFAILPLMITNLSNSLMIGFLLVWPFVIDTFFTFIMRLINKENIFTPHRSHLYQKLVISGLSHKAVTKLYIFLSFVGLLCSITLLFSYLQLTLISIFIIIFCCFLLISYTHRRTKIVNTKIPKNQ